MVSIHGTRNCGVFELDNLSSVKTPEQAFMDAMYGILRYNIDFPFLTFTGVVKFAKSDESYLHVGNLREDNYGENFAKFIETNKLGTIVRSDPRVNWSDNTIQLWIWQIDRPAAYRMFEKLLPEGK